jgi:hypothetical protein
MCGVVPEKLIMFFFGGGGGREVSSVICRLGRYTDYLF